MGDSGTPLLSVTQTRDGVWSVNERGGAARLLHEYKQEES